MDIDATFQILTVKNGNHWQRLLLFLVFSTHYGHPFIFQRHTIIIMKIVKVNILFKKVIYFIEHDKRDKFPPPLPPKNITSNTNIICTERYRTLATAHQRSYLLLLADSVKRGPTWSEGAFPHTLCCNSTNNVTNCYHHLSQFLFKDSNTSILPFKLLLKRIQLRTII